MSKPYKDIISKDNSIIRTFGKDIDPIELMWHRDLKSRVITIIEGKNWKFQHDNQLPIELHEGTQISIEKLTYHRLIKGQGKLILQIQEL